jgi:enoyl-CoA hydratase/carnithine racemase
MLPEVGHGVIPDTGGVARLFQICGHGVTADMVLTGRVMDADEALAHGVVSRVVSPERLDEEVHAVAAKIAEAPAVTVRTARRILGHLAVPEVIASMDEEMIAQTFIARSDDMSEMRAARVEDRPPVYRGS